MRKLLTFAGLLFTFLGSMAQGDMPVVWETKLSHHIQYTGTSLEGEHSYAASDKEITVFDNIPHTKVTSYHNNGVHPTV